MFYMDINHIKFIGAGVFIQVTQLVFFYRKESAKKVGLYNLKYKFSSDYDYFFRMIVKHKMKGVATNKDELFGIFRRGGFRAKYNS